MKIRCRHCNAPNEVPGTAIEVADTTLCCESCGAPLRSPGTAALARERLLKDSPLSRLPLRKASPVWPAAGGCPFPAAPEPKTDHPLEPESFADSPVGRALESVGRASARLEAGDLAASRPAESVGRASARLEAGDLAASRPAESVGRPLRQGPGQASGRQLGPDGEAMDLPDLGSVLAARGDRPPRPRPPAVTPPPRTLPVPRTKKRHPVGTFFAALVWGTAALALLAVALAQLAWLRPDVLLVDPRVRHWAELACQGIGCEVPPPTDLKAIRVIAHALEPLEDADGISQLHVRFDNAAAFAQPYPVLQLSLLDTEEHIVARRRLQPDEYLRPGTHGPTLAAGARVDVRLWLEVPDPRVAGYRVDFVRR
jgi:hypothetical protein